MVTPEPTGKPATRLEEILISRPGLSRRSNILIVGLLVVIILVYFNWQVRHSTQIYFAHVRQQSSMLAGVIRLNADNSLLSKELLVKTVERFLSNSAEFIEYLNGIEPFTTSELTAFADEAGLTGIRIVSVGSPEESPYTVEGPPGRLPEKSQLPDTFQHVKETHLFVLTRPDISPGHTITVGYDAEYIENLEQKTGLPALLASLEQLPGIHGVHLEPSTGNPASGADEVEVQLDPEQQLVAVRLPLDEKLLVVQLDSSHYYTQVNRLWREFFVFSVAIIFLGLFFSWLLSRFQNAHIRQMQMAERRLAQQHEDATLGRAVATISHEIKNPLNAIGMGLQRLRLEMDHIDPDHQGLIDSMLLAVNRTSHIISDLKHHALPISPRYKEVALAELVEATLTLYQQKTDDHNITVNYTAGFDGNIDADEYLIGQLVENLVKNAIEAQPRGGYITITVGRHDNTATVVMENSGLTIEAADVDSILEPYFTTKTKGAGLGLALSKRIAEAHQGHMELTVPEKGILRSVVTLPCRRHDQS